MTKPPRTTCLKVDFLRREQGVDNVKEWLNKPNNVYAGRSQRVFIHWKRPLKAGEEMPEGSYLDKAGNVVERFVLPDSIWYNPYKVDKKKPYEEEIVRVLAEFRTYFEKRLLTEPGLFKALKGLRVGDSKEVTDLFYKEGVKYLSMNSKCDNKAFEEFFEPFEK